MPNLNELTQDPLIKLLLIGDSGTGKTGSIASLVAAGYKIRMIDMDAGWQALGSAVRRQCPDKIGNVEVEAFRDKYKASPLGPILDGQPTAFVSALKLLDHWKVKDLSGTERDLGRPAEWGTDTILVLDSLTFFSDAAFAWANFMNPGVKDKRQIYGAAQEVVEHALALLTGENFRTNVIVTAHIMFIDMPDGTKRGYPTAVGKALSPTIPRYFNSVACCQTQPGGKRSIQTSSTALIDLKNPSSFNMQTSLPIETGLADFFKTLKGK